MDRLSVKEAYALLSNAIVPRPIAFVSTVSNAGVANLAPFSFFVVGGSNPPSIAFSPVVGSSGVEKDTLRNIRENGEYVINLVHREMADGMNRASATLPPDESEWAHAGFTPLPSDRVRPCRVAESWAHFECRAFTVVEHGEGSGAARYVIGEILVAHVTRRFIQDGQLIPTAFDLIARLGGSNYLDCGALERFQITRPG